MGQQNQKNGIKIEYEYHYVATSIGYDDGYIDAYAWAIVDH